MSDDRSGQIFEVVTNHEEQYSIWPASKEVPEGWRLVGKRGTREECLSHVSTVWSDMRPLSARLDRS
ncbi:MbtH family NRPS accessory protein [Streptomyces sp. NPDC089799]|uniref:MbtH family protein n=1 Tax=Streptomyces sp. NPDC089799 TaxID=3155066 RepID=UPI00343519C7